jgi:acyl-CoA reductase-like NAD-dependent aldehyde dehydrogenase
MTGAGLKVTASVNTWPSDLPAVSAVDGTVLGWHRSAASDAAPEAVRALRSAGAEWAELPLSRRLECIRRLRETLAARAEVLTSTLALEVGRPVVEGYGAELLPTLQYLGWLERNAARVLRGEVLAWLPRRVVERRPHGVIGLLSPWNYPIYLSITAIAGALAAGNTVLWKPSELALETSAGLREVLESAGLGSLVHCLPGDDRVGAALAAAGCDRYVLIGSTQTGRSVLARLGEQLRSAVAELSGVDPMLVLPDADVELAARCAVWARMIGAGQTCMAPKRLFVAAPIYELFLDSARKHVATLRVGHPLDRLTEVGPLRTEALREHALELVEDAVQHGARLLAGGCSLPGPGNLFQPTLLADCNEEMRIFREDLFAPVLAVTPFTTVAEAVERASAGVGVLTASVWTRDRRRGREIARRLGAGVVSMNDVMLPAARPDTPFGGAGSSGFGKMRGAEGLREMTRAVVVDDGPLGAAPRMALFPYRQGTVEILRGAVSLEGASGLGRFAAMRRLMAAAREYRQLRNE